MLLWRIFTYYIICIYNFIIHKGICIRLILLEIITNKCSQYNKVLIFQLLSDFLRSIYLSIHHIILEINLFNYQNVFILIVMARLHIIFYVI